MGAAHTKLIRWGALLGALLVALPMTAQRYKPYYAIERLPASINSSGEESKPIMIGDSLFFARAFHEDNVGVFAQDIWFTYQDSTGKWAPPSNQIEHVNDEFNNVILGASLDGSLVYLLNSYKLRVIPRLAVSVVQMKGSSVTRPKDVKIRDLRPEDQYYDAYVDAGSGIIVVSMNYADTYGAEDLYLLRQDEKGKYSILTNLGPVVNSTGFEISPYLTPDKKRLYFASDGHGGLGDADIFFCDRLDNTWTNWSKPMPLAAPVNSPGFDASFYMADSTTAYFSSLRNGAEFADLYRLNLTKQELIPGTEPVVVPVVVEPEPVVADATTPNGNAVANNSNPNSTGNTQGQPMGNTTNGLAQNNTGTTQTPTNTSNTDAANPTTQTNPTGTPVAANTNSTAPTNTGNTSTPSGNTGSTVTYAYDPETGNTVAVTTPNSNAPTTAQTNPSAGNTNTVPDHTHTGTPVTGTPTTGTNTSVAQTGNINPNPNTGADSYATNTTGNPVTKPETENPGYLPPDRTVYFGLDSEKLDFNAEVVLDMLITEWKRQPNLVLFIEGHTDDAGDKRYNLELAGRRAQSVRDYLLRKGMGDFNFVIIAVGEANPAVRDSDARNRRVEMYFQNGFRQR